MIPVPAIKVQQQMRLPGDLVIPVRGGALDVGLDVGGAAAGARPGAEEPRGRDLDEDVLARLVLHEAEEGLAVAEGEDRHVDGVGGGLVHEGLGGAEGLEVGGVGVADFDVGGGPCVLGIRGRVLIPDGSA